MNPEKPKVITISRQPSPVQVVVDLKWQKNVEHLNCFGSLPKKKNDARCTRKIESRIVAAKAAFYNNKTLSASKSKLNLRKKLVKCYIWNTALNVAQLLTLVNGQLSNFTLY
jgi:hypothetical protein